MNKHFAAVVLLAVACGKSNSSSPGAAGGGKTAETTSALAPVTLNASGSTFQKAFQEVAIESFTKANPQIKINYAGGGSGKGRQDFADQVTDFGCTDGAFKAADLANVKGGDFLYVPILLGAVTVAYNVPGAAKLQLTAETLAKIFQRDIKKWNDPAIAAVNPGVTLPDLAIVVAHRSDGSGTTENFTKYLQAAATATWKLNAGSTVEWPADTQAGAGNGGVAQIVKSTAGAIGYVDLPDAKAAGLAYAHIQNAAGKFIEPTTASAQAAGDGVAVDDKLLFSALNAAGDQAYPITLASWCVVYTKPSAAKAAALHRYFAFMVGDGQKLTTEIDYAPLSATLQAKAVQAIAVLAAPANNGTTPSHTAK